MWNLSQTLDRLQWYRWEGTIHKVTGLILECSGIASRVGELCRIVCRQDGREIFCEVIGIREQATLLMPLDYVEGIGYGDKVIPCGRKLSVNVGEFLTGCVVNGYGIPLSDAEFPGGCLREINGESLNPLERPPITSKFATSIRAIDALLTCGKGQRLGIFAGSGVGKSTLLGSLARNSEAEVAVLALIGERGREVRTFIEDCLGQEGLARSVVVVATSDTSPIQRLKGVLTALTIAEYFRDNGKDVMFMCDSITRVAMAIREIGLARNEPPTLRGYPPSLYSLLSQMVERLGNTTQGSITGFFTVLVEGDDFNEPVADTMRSLLDGHIVLTRELAQQGHFPAIDCLQSASRIMNEIVSDEHRQAANRFRLLYHTYRNAQELINIGAYKAGSNVLIDQALQKIAAMNDFLSQDYRLGSDFASSTSQLIELMRS